MQAAQTQRPGSVDSGAYALRIVRVEAGTSFTFRVLSDHYGGVLTHWHGGRSLYCPGPDDCPSVTHRTPTFWKGYLPCEIWAERKGQWFACLLELTEHAELDIRGRCKRGQLWTFSRALNQGKHRQPVVGNLLETRDAAKWPQTFEYSPVLRTLYHVEKIKADKANPMPAKVIVTPSIDQGPHKPGVETADPASAQAIHEMVERFTKKMPQIGAMP